MSVPSHPPIDPAVELLSTPTAGTHDPLERSEETDRLLREAWTASAARREELLARVVVLNQGIANSVAHRFRDRGLPLEDLRQTAYLGLLKAVRRFDPDLSEDLLSFAVPTIRGEIQRYFRDFGWTVRPPRRIQELQQQISKTTPALGSELGREPSPADLARALGVAESEVAEAFGAFGCFRLTSLDKPLGDDADRPLGDLLGSDADERGAVEARVALAPALRRLTERDRRILYLRFFEDRTQAEIGTDIGVTQMQVSRLLNRIMDDLRAELVE
ncbi:MAG: sigma-70 family RNA polymerase sigma factor [Nocardioides sp.]